MEPFVCCCSVTTPSPSALVTVTSRNFLDPEIAASKYGKVKTLGVDNSSNIIRTGRFLDSRMAQTADAACTQLRVPSLPRTGDEDEADSSRRLRQSRGRGEEWSTRKTSSGGDPTCFVPGTQPFYTASSTAAVPALRNSCKDLVRGLPA